MFGNQHNYSMGPDVFAIESGSWNSHLYSGSLTVHNGTISAEIVSASDTVHSRHLHIKNNANFLGQVSASSFGSYGSNTLVTMSDASSISQMNFNVRETLFLKFYKQQGQAGITTFNPQGYNQDFIVESHADQHALVVNGGNNNVGIGLDNPTSKLQVEGNISANSSITRSDLKISGGITAPSWNGPGSSVNITDSLEVDGNIRANGRITGSDLRITGDNVDFTKLPTSSAGANTGGLYTRTGAQLGFTETNATGSKFVLVK